MLRNGALSLAGLGGSFLIIIIFTPLLFRLLGTQGFGIWTLVVSVLGLAGFLEAGIGTAMVRFVAHYRSTGDVVALSGVATAALWLALTAGLLIMAALFLAAPVADSIFQGPSSQSSLIGQELRFTSLGLVAVLLRGSSVGIIMGLQRYDISAALAILQGLLTWGAAALAAWLVGTLHSVVVATVGATWLSSLTALVVATLILRKLGVRMGRPLSQMRPLLPYAFFTVITGLGEQIFGTVDKLTVGAVLGVKELAYYGIIAGVASKINQVVGMISRALVPVASSLKARRDFRSLERYFTYSMMACAALSVFLGGTVILGSELLLRLWLGPEFAEHSVNALRILVGVYVVFSLNAPAYHIANGLGAAWVCAATSVLGGCATITLIVFLGHLLGLTGAAIANAGFWCTLLNALYVQRSLAVSRNARASAKVPPEDKLRR